MNRLFCSLLIVNCVGIGWLASAASAQSDSQGIPLSIKSANEIDPNGKKIIGNYVDGQIKKLLDQSKPNAQGLARDSLIRQVAGGDQATNTRAFTEEYSASLSHSLESLLANKDLRVKLNAAIILAKVAEKTNSSQLKDVALKCMKDQTDAVALWGIKAAGAILPEALKLQALASNNELIPAIIKAAKEHPSPAVVQEATEALTLGLLRQIRRDGSITNNMLQAVIPSMQQLLDFRIKQYIAGQVDEPMSENRTLQFLGDNQVWGAQDPKQQMQTMQAMSDLLWLGAQRVQGLPQGKDREQFMLMVSGTAKAMQVVTGSFNDQNLSDALMLASKVDKGTSDDEVKRRTKPIHGLLIMIPQFPKLTAPPQIAP